MTKHNNGVKHVTVRITDEDFKKLTKLGEKYEGNISWMIRQWIREKKIKKTKYG